MVWTLSHMSLRGGRPFWMSGSCQVAFRDVREPPPRLSGSGRESLSDVRERSEDFRVVREWSGDLPGCPGVVGSLSRMSRRPARMSGNVRKAFPDVWEALSAVRERSRSSLGCPGVVGRLSRLFGRVSQPLQDNRKGVPTTPGHP